MEEKLNSITQKYYEATSEEYRSYYYDENEKEFSMVKEVAELFQSSGLEHKISEDECYDDCSYSCAMLSVAWVENGVLYLRNILRECH